MITRMCFVHICTSKRKNEVSLKICVYVLSIIVRKGMMNLINLYTYEGKNTYFFFASFYYFSICQYLSNFIEEKKE